MCTHHPTHRERRWLLIKFWGKRYRLYIYLLIGLAWRHHHCFSLVLHQATAFLEFHPSRFLFFSLTLSHSAVVTQIINSSSVLFCKTEHVYLCTTPHLVMLLTNQSLFCVPCVPPTRMLCEWVFLMFANMPVGGALLTHALTLPSNPPFSMSWWKNNQGLCC